MSIISQDQLAIDTSNFVIIDGRATNYRAIQRKGKTFVYRNEIPWKTSSAIIELPLPHDQYSLAHDKPACGAGRPEFYRDFKAAIEKAGA